MLRSIRKLIVSRTQTRDRSREQDEKALLRARLIAVAVARTTHYAEIRQ